MKKILGRRRRHERRHHNGDNVDLPHGGKLKGHRKRGVRRKRAASLLLGLSTIMPVPGAKLIYPASAKNGKAKITVSSSTNKKRQDSGSNTIYLGPGYLSEVHLWTPPSFDYPINENEEIAVTSLKIKPVELFLPEDLKPAFTYSEIVYPICTKHKLDWRLVAAVIQAESGFNPDAVSPVGARGLMQLMPATAADYGLTLKKIHDPEANVEAGVRHLKMLARLYDGDIPLIAAAYNAGQGTVAKFNGIPPFEETQTYVERVVSYYNSFAA